jgi:hypothetical protein
MFHCFASGPRAVTPPATASTTLWRFAPRLLSFWSLPVPEQFTVPTPPPPPPLHSPHSTSFLQSYKYRHNGNIFYSSSPTPPIHSHRLPDLTPLSTPGRSRRHGELRAEGAPVPHGAWPRAAQPRRLRLRRVGRLRSHRHLHQPNQ